MTITFENENNIIVYALEKIICYARDNRYLFVAQSVWWLASIIGLSEGLATHIDNLRVRFEANHLIAEEDQLSSKKDSPDKILESCVTETQERNIHPDRILQVGRVSESPEDINSHTELDQATILISEGEKFISQSRKERKAYKQKPSALSRTRSGQVSRKPLTKKQRNRLRAIPTDTLQAYLLSQK